MKESFKIADHVLSQAVQSIADLVATPGLINVDFNDVRAIMSGRGGAVMGVGMGKGENRALEAVKKATSSPLLDKIVIDGATGVLICITGGADMTLAEVNEATQLVKEAADPDAEIIFGAVIDETLTDMMRVTIIATGFPEDVQRRQVSGTASKPAASGFLSAPLRPAEKPTLSQAIRSSERPAPAAPVAQAADSLDGVALFDAIEEKKEAPKPAPAAPPRADSLRSTLERMISEQGNGNGNGGARPAAPRGNGNGAPAAPAAPSHPAVRTASSSRTDVAVKAAAAAEEVAVPAVKMFDAAEADKDEKSDFDTPAFLRRRRSLFE